MRLLLATGSVQRHSPRPGLAVEQIDAGPDQLDRDFNGRIFSRFTPRGSYDLAALVETLPVDQRPEVIACSLDGNSVSWPSNLAACGGVRVLLLGNLFAPSAGTGKVLDYLRRESFDRVVMTGSDADRDLILSAGVTSLHWLPGLLCPVTDRVASLVRQDGQQPFIACAPPHARRYSALNLSLSALYRGRLPPTYWPLDHHERMEFLGHSDVVVLPSEHGEWSAEWFEALAAGALILTDAPSEISRRLWPEGTPFGIVNSPEELAGRIDHYRKNPVEANALRKAAAVWYDENLGETKRQATFHTLVSAPADLPEFARTASVDETLSLDFSALQNALPLITALEGLLARKASATASIDRKYFPEIHYLAARFTRLDIFDDAKDEGACDFATAYNVANSRIDLSGVEILWAPGGTDSLLGMNACVPNTPLYQRAAIIAAERQLRESREHLERGAHGEAWDLSQPLLSQPAGFADAIVIAADAAVEMAQEQRWTGLRNILRQLDGNDPRLRHLETRHALKIGLCPKRLIEHGWVHWENGDNGEALALADQVIAKHPRMPWALRLRASALQRMNRADDAVSAWEDVVRYAPNFYEARLDRGLLLWKLDRRMEATDALRRSITQGSDDRIAGLIKEALSGETGNCQVLAAPERDLLITMPETNRRHGTGVLLRRFFPVSDEFVTLRSFTNYEGVEEFGGANLLLSDRSLNAAERVTRLRRLLEPFRIRRILCVPFSPADFQHAAAVQAFTGAPLCTYVMDDQNLATNKVPDGDATALFAASRLRLTISPEMQAGYAAKFSERFDLMPPIVTDTDGRRENRWSPAKRAANHAVLVGNVWSDGQLKQLAQFVVRAGLRVDWFGREAHPALAKVGLHGQGFLPEAELAERLVTYPFVIVPSGTLDGTEGNEWLTRLSLPSRLVFLLQTQTPMLVLGSPATAAARFVHKLGLGLVLPYADRDPRRAVRTLTQPLTRRHFCNQATFHADAFVLPDAGEWIWNSLAAGRALPAPFDDVFQTETSHDNSPPVALAS